jgi:hypothetical protein
VFLPGWLILVTVRFGMEGNSTVVEISLYTLYLMSDIQTVFSNSNKSNGVRNLGYYGRNHIQM